MVRQWTGFFIVLHKNLVLFFIESHNPVFQMSFIIPHLGRKGNKYSDIYEFCVIEISFSFAKLYIFIADL